MTHCSSNVLHSDKTKEQSEASVHLDWESDSNDELTKDQLELNAYEELRRWIIAEIEIHFVVVLKSASL
jgi:hypothetical protein